MPDIGTPLVDCHAHIFNRHMRFASGAHTRPDYEYPVQSWLSDMAAHGITHGVIAAASLYDDGNAYTLQALASHPNLRATIMVSPDADAAQLGALADRGAAGVRLAWRRLETLPDLASPPWPGFLRRLADSGLYVELLASGADMAAVLPVLNAAGPDVVVDHFGVPGRDLAVVDRGIDAMLRAAQGGKCWIKLSAGFRMPYEIAARVTDRLVTEAGADRLLWGSDAPFVNHEDSVGFSDAIALYRQLVPDTAIRAEIDLAAMKLHFAR